MQYRPETEKVAMIDRSYISVPKQTSLAEHPQIRRIRNSFMIVLGVCLALCVVNLFMGIIESVGKNQTGNVRQSASLGPAIIAILFYGFGFFAAFRYSTIGLRVFGWLGIIILVIMGFGLIFVFFIFLEGLTILVRAKGNHTLDVESSNATVDASVIALSVVGVYFAVYVLSVVMVIFAFKFARLIDANRHSIRQQT